MDLIKFKRGLRQRCKGVRACSLANCNKKFMCRHCKVARKRLCASYHGVDPVCELLGRLVYELTFDILPEAAVVEGWWLKRGLRDCGHHERMEGLWRRCCGKVTWLEVRCNDY